MLLSRIILGIILVAVAVLTVLGCRKLFSLFSKGDCGCHQGKLKQTSHDCHCRQPKP